MLDATQKERMLLGAVIADNSLASLLAPLTDDCFAEKDHRLLFRRIRQLAAEKKPIDPTMIADAYTGIDASAALNLATSVLREGSVWNARQYAKDLHEIGEKRRLYKIFRKCADSLIAGDELQTVMDECRTEMRGIGTASGKVTHMPEVCSRTLDRMEAVRKGEIQTIPSGLGKLDELTGGFEAGEMIIVGARPAVGKSAFGMSIALSAARAGKRVLVCSCEMSDVQYARRIAAEITGINGMKLKNADLSDDQWVAIGDALNEMARLGIGFTFNTRTIEELYSICLGEKEENGLDLLVVDYIQLLDTKTKCENEAVKISRVSTRLKQIALELQIPVVALAQVNRQEGIADRMPTLKELKGSGSLEQDGDKVIFLHRVESANDPYCTGSGMLDRIKAAHDQMIAVYIAKQRDGATAWFGTRFLPGRMKYFCIT